MPMSSPTMSFQPDLQCQTSISLCGMGFNSKQKAVGYCHNICATVVLMGTPYVGHYCSSLLSKSVDDPQPSTPAPCPQ